MGAGPPKGRCLGERTAPDNGRQHSAASTAKMGSEPFHSKGGSIMHSPSAMGTGSIGHGGEP
jgi:hypothetical protein